jgi:hypothetical protein
MAMRKRETESLLPAANHHPATLRNYHPPPHPIIPKDDGGDGDADGQSRRGGTVGGWNTHTRVIQQQQQRRRDGKNVERNGNKTRKETEEPKREEKKR